MAEEEKAGGGELESEGEKVGENGAADGAAVNGIKGPVNGVGSPGKAVIKEVDSKEQNGVKKPKEGEDAEADQDDQGAEGSTSCFWYQHLCVVCVLRYRHWHIEGCG